MNALYRGFPVKLANHIAKSCGLPGMFLGTYGETRIQYIYLCHTTDQIPEPVLCCVIQSNQGRRGFTMTDAGEVSALVNLPDEDSFFDVLKTYRDFPDEFDAWWSSRATGLNVSLLFPGGVIEHELHNAVDAGEPSFALYQAYTKMAAMLNTHLKDPAAMVAPGFNYRQLPGVDFKNDMDSFIERYGYLSIFGQSGLFGQLDAPHDTEFLLEINQSRGIHVFIKTRRYFRGVYIRGDYDPLHYPVFELEAPDVDWDTLIQSAEDTSVPHGKIQPFRSYVDVHYSSKDADSYVRFNSLKPVEHPAFAELWQAVQALIAQFPDVGVSS